MNNFSHATEATDTALNSAGSAARENERYMQSLEAQVTQLRATFQELANNVINSELVSALLNLANAFLELLNTPVGIFATQVVLFTGAIYGLLKVLQSANIVGNVIAQFKNLGTILTGAATAATTMGAAGTVAGAGASAMGAGATVAAGGMTALSTAMSAAIPIIGAIVIGVQAVVAIWDAFTVSNKELQESIDTTKQKISDLKTEFATLENKEDPTESDKARLAVLQQQIDAQERLLQQQYELQYSREFGSDAFGNQSTNYTNLYSDIEEWNELNETIKENEETILRWSESSADMSRQIGVLGEKNEELKDRQAELGQSITDTYDKMATFADELDKTPEDLEKAMEATEEWAKANQTAEDTADNLAESSDNLADSVSDTGDTIEQSTEQAKTAIDQLSELDEAYGTLMDAVDEYNSTGQFTISTLESLLNLDDSYRDMLVEEDGQLKINTKSLQDKKDALVKAYTEERIAALSAELYEIAMNRANSELDNSKTALANSETKVNTWSTAVTNAVNSAISLTDAVMGLDTALGADPNWLGLTEEQEAASKAAIERAREDLEMFQRFSLSTGSRSSGGSGSGGSSSTKKETDPIEEQSKIFEEQNKQIEWNIKMRERQGASEEELIELQKQLQDQLHEQAEWYRGEGLDETSQYLQDTIDGWWDAQDAIEGYQDDIKENQRDALDEMLDDTQDYIDFHTEFTDMGAAEEYQIWVNLMTKVDELYNQGLVDYEYYVEKRQEILINSLRAQQRAEEEAQEAAEEARKNYIKGLEDQASVYETLFDLVAKKAQDEIDALNKRKEDIEDYYDKQIEALQKTNEELEKEIQKEQLLDNLARARQSQVMVYQDGRWQYVQNVDEVSEAQAELEAYERDQALQQEVDNLNRLKEQAIASLDQQIEAWEEYKEQWASVVENYQEKQDELLVSQELGIELEGENWTERLGNMEVYVSQYEALMQRIVAAQQMANAAMSGGSIGGGYSSGITVGGGGGGGGGRVQSTQERVQDELEYMEWYADGDPDKMLEWIVGNNGYAPSEALDIATDIYNDTVGSGGKQYDDIHDLLEDNDPDYHYSGGSAHKENVSYTDSSGKTHYVQGNNTTNSGYTISASGLTKNPDGSYSGKYPLGNKKTSSSSNSSKKSSSSSGSVVVDTVKDVISTVGNAIGSLFGKKANGTLSDPGGISLVGEEGPELRVLNRGDGIIPADITANLWKWGSTTPDQLMTAFNGFDNASSSLMNVTIENITLPSVQNPSDFVEWMKNNLYKRAVQYNYTAR